MKLFISIFLLIAILFFGTVYTFLLYSSDELAYLVIFILGILTSVGIAVIIGKDI